MPNHGKLKKKTFRVYTLRHSERKYCTFYGNRFVRIIGKTVDVAVDVQSKISATTFVLESKTLRGSRDEKRDKKPKTKNDLFRFRCRPL